MKPERLQLYEQKGKTRARRNGIGSVSLASPKNKVSPPGVDGRVFCGGAALITTNGMHSIYEIILDSASENSRLNKLVRCHT